MQEKIKFLENSYCSLVSKVSRPQPITINHSADCSSSNAFQLCSTPKRAPVESDLAMQSIIQPSPAPQKIVKPCTPIPQRLHDSEEVVRLNPKLLALSSIGRLAVKLAREAYFGQTLMSQCTVYGYKGLPALPKDSLLQLKNKLLSLHPQFLNTPVEFESYWKTAVDALNYAMAKQRSKCIINIDLSV